ncbi:MAG: hypothetical protein NTW60_03900 [Candidatus Wolfebacteria bacterium]|nr:hypothetical protein [Candidatus Wolfebacteria bacterium]
MKMPKFKKPNLKSILLYYSVVLSTILIIGGFYTARSTREIISNLLFLPIAIFLWILLIQKIRKIKEVNLPTKIRGSRVDNNKL